MQFLRYHQDLIYSWMCDIYFLNRATKYIYKQSLEYNFNGQSLKLPDECGPTISDHTKQHCRNKRSMITPEAWTPVIINNQCSSIKWIERSKEYVLPRIQVDIDIDIDI